MTYLDSAVVVKLVQEQEETSALAAAFGFPVVGAGRRGTFDDVTGAPDEE